jgi:hypothetical protein
VTMRKTSCAFTPPTIDFRLHDMKVTRSWRTTQVPALLQSKMDCTVYNNNRGSILCIVEAGGWWWCCIVMSGIRHSSLAGLRQRVGASADAEEGGW